MLSAAILKPLVFGMSKVAFIVGSSVSKDKDLVLKFVDLTEPPVCNDSQFILSVGDSVSELLVVFVIGTKLIDGIVSVGSRLDIARALESL